MADVYPARRRERREMSRPGRREIRLGAESTETKATPKNCDDRAMTAMTTAMMEGEDGDGGGDADDGDGDNQTGQAPHRFQRKGTPTTGRTSQMA